MGSKNIYVIVGDGWDEPSVVDELEDEGYVHDFYFGINEELILNLVDMISADEVWCFGDCEGLEVYEHAREFKLDIWRMG